MQCFKRMPVTKLRTYRLSVFTQVGLGWYCFTVASRGQTSNTSNEKQKSQIWMEFGGMKGRARWQQQNHRQSHWAHSWNPSATGTKLSRSLPPVHFKQTLKTKNASVWVTLALLRLPAELECVVRKLHLKPKIVSFFFKEAVVPVDLSAKQQSLTITVEWNKIVCRWWSLSFWLFLQNFIWGIFGKTETERTWQLRFPNV